MEEEQPAIQEPLKEERLPKEDRQRRQIERSGPRQ